MEPTDQIAADLQRIIQQQIHKQTHDDTVYEKLYYELKEQVETKIEESKSIIEEHKKEGFTIATAQEEGYLQALTEMKRTFSEYEEIYISTELKKQLA